MKTIAGALIAVALVFGSGCARTDWIDRTLVTVDVTGVWQTDDAPRNTLSLELKQEGPKVTGYMRTRLLGTPWSGPSSSLAEGPIEGSVNGDALSFRQMNGPIVGQMTVSGEEMTGRMFLQNAERAFSLRRIK